MPDNRRLTIGDSLGLAALIITVVSVIITFPLWFKAVLLCISASGCVAFANKSHWTHTWKLSVRWSLGACLVVGLVILGVPQFLEQWELQRTATTDDLV
jgi:hypothetical protein